MDGIAFELGFDHYRYDLPLAIDRFPVNVRQDLRDGYEAAKFQNASRKKPDMFERKLLTIRDRALIKQLPVSIGTDDLKAALKETKGICPIIGLPLTYSSNADTDWSVDRVDNRLGYIPGNIVVISSRANEAKDNLDLAGIIKQAFLFQEDDLLPVHGWLNMARFYFRRMELLKPVRLCQLLHDDPGPIEFILLWELLGQGHSKPARKRLRKELEAVVGKSFLDRAAKHACKRVHSVPDLEYEIITNSPKLSANMAVLTAAVINNCDVFDPILVECLFG